MVKKTPNIAQMPMNKASVLMTSFAGILFGAGLGAASYPGNTDLILTWGIVLGVVLGILDAWSWEKDGISIWGRITGAPPAYSFIFK